jgi:hypothetical protein
MPLSPILDWYFKHAEFLKGKYIAKYLTFYSDLCRWFVIDVLNIHYEHSVENNSDEERIHLLVHGKKKKEFWDDVYSWR